MTPKHREIYAVVRRIPRGRVATYAQVARLAGLTGQPRLVGYALAASSGLRLPWQRVINARGEISRRALPGAETEQRRMLEDEGLRFDAKGRVSLARYQWRPQDL